LSFILIVSAAGCQTSTKTAASSQPDAKAQATAAAPAATQPEASVPTATEPLFAGMGDHHRTVTTKSADAQKYFDQGLIFSFSFNHDEAIRSFTQAAVFDPDCAMAYWGIALCNGPHINNPLMDEAHRAAAWEALQKAQAKSDGASPTERALINALA